MFSEFGFLSDCEVKIPEHNLDVIHSDLQDGVNNKLVLFTAFEEDEAAIKFREILYSYHFDGGVEVIDVGNINTNLKVSKKNEAIEIISKSLVQQQCIPLFISPSTAFVIPFYAAFEHYEQWVSMCDISSTLSFEYDSYLLKILTHKPNFLFNYAHLAGQAYIMPSEIKQTLSALNYNEIRLGNLRGNPLIAEPTIRTADIVLMNCNALKYAEIGNLNCSPNGLHAEDFCQLAMYAGASDQCNALVLINASEENTKVELSFLAQSMWCFVSGLVKRLGDYPIGDYSNYTRYDVLLEKEDKTIVFYKSNISERWWLKTPDNINKKSLLKRHALIPCTENDYLQSAKGILPKVWWTEILK